MKTSRFLCPFVGALVAFGGTLFLIRFLGRSGFGWVEVVLKPGIAVAELTDKVCNSISVCIWAGVLTMTLIGAAVGWVVDLLAASSDDK